MRTLFEADALTIRLGELAVLREAAAYDVLDGDGRAVGSIVQDVGSVGNVVGRLLSIDRVPSISFAIRDRDGSALALLTRRRARGLLPRVRIGLALANGTEVVSAITRGTSRSSFRGVDHSEAPLADITLSPPALFEVRGADGAAVGRVDLEPATLSARRAGTAQPRGYRITFREQTDLAVRMLTVAVVVGFDSLLNFRSVSLTSYTWPPVSSAWITSAASRSAETSGPCWSRSREVLGRTTPG